MEYSNQIGNVWNQLLYQMCKTQSENWSTHKLLEKHDFRDKREVTLSIGLFSESTKRPLALEVYTGTTTNNKGGAKVKTTTP